MSAPEGLAAEIKIAAQEAQLAQSATSMKDVKAHLQQVINCIERGKEGSCASMGTSMMANAKAMGAKAPLAVAWVEMARDVATVGMKANTMEKAKACAWTAQAVLEHGNEMLR